MIVPAPSTGWSLWVFGVAARPSVSTQPPGHRFSLSSTLYLPRRQRGRGSTRHKAPGRPPTPSTGAVHSRTRTHVHTAGDAYKGQGTRQESRRVNLHPGAPTPDHPFGRAIRGESRTRRRKIWRVERRSSRDPGTVADKMATRIDPPRRLLRRALYWNRWVLSRLARGSEVATFSQKVNSFNARARRK